MSAENYNDYTKIRDLGSHPDSFPIVPHATNALPRVVRAIRATVAGNVVVVTASGAERTLAFLAGETRYVVCTHVRVAGTTATGLEGMP